MFVQEMVVYYLFSRVDSVTNVNNSSTSSQTASSSGGKCRNSDDGTGQWPDPPEY